RFSRDWSSDVCSSDLSGSRFHILEPSFAVAAQVHRRLEQANCLNTQAQAGNSAFISSAPVDQAQRVIQALTGLSEPSMLAFPIRPEERRVAERCQSST